MQKYTGELTMRGEGVSQLRGATALTRYSVIELGSQEIRDLCADDYISTQLQVGEHLELWVQRLAFRNWIMGVKRDGKIRKLSFKYFVPLMIMVFVMWFVSMVFFVGSGFFWIPGLAVAVFTLWLAGFVQALRARARIG